MRFRTWLVAALGLAGLLVLVAVSLITAMRRAQVIYSQLDQLNAEYRDVDDKLRHLRSDVNLSGIFVRDYLLDTERERAPEYRDRLAEFRASNVATLSELRVLVRSRPADEERIAHLAESLDEYWETFEPVFDWTPIEKQTLSLPFLRKRVLPRREAVLAIAQQIEELNRANLAIQREAVDRSYADFTAYMRRLLWRVLLLGAVVALIAVARLRVLEKRSHDLRIGSLEAERAMRDLSQQIVATQEEERRKLSRELHDHVGQLLTALRMELARVDRLRGTADAGVAVAECRQLVDSVVRVVRDLSLGLRPSMLDDFGLEPALEWLVRDVSRRSGLAIDLQVTGGLEVLSEQARTCIYRVVQEGLTNCVRHAHASHADVAITRNGGTVRGEITDDGDGFDPEARGPGLGLRGMEERVKELRGTFAVLRREKGGTMVAFTLPAAAQSNREVAFASAAG
jgi:signal transduction histidine kinase